MIEVSIKLDPAIWDAEIAKITIEKVQDHEDWTSDYSVRFAVDRLGAVGLHQRVVRNYDRRRFNVLGLLALALQTLTPEELELEYGTSASDLARRQRGSRVEIPR